MSLQQLAQTLQAEGRNNDTMLVHMTPGEVAGLQALAEANGGSLSINPETGLPEAGFLEDILPMVAGAAAMFIPGMQGVGAYLLAGGIGGMAGLATQKDGESGFGAFFRGALGGVGGAGLGSMAVGGLGAGAAGGAGSAGSAAGAGAETLAAAAGTGVEGALATGMTQAEMLAAQTAGMGVTDAAIPLAQQAASAGSYGLEGAYQTAQPTIDVMGDGVYGATADGTFGTAYDTAMQEALAANQAGAAEIPLTDPSGYDLLEGPIDKAKYWWKTGGKENIDKGMKVYQQANKVLGGGQRSAPQYAPMPSSPGYSPARVDLPSGGGGGGFAPRWSQGSGAGAPGAARESQMARQRQAAYAQKRWFAEGGEVGMESGGFVVPADVVSAIGSGSTDAGLQALAGLGAEPIKGPGDGQSDDIPATIDGKAQARVADGEAYLPPQAVARIGGGDHKTGAKRLYNMLDQARKQAYGHTEQMRPVSIDKALA